MCASSAVFAMHVGDRELHGGIAFVSEREEPLLAPAGLARSDPYVGGTRRTFEFAQESVGTVHRHVVSRTDWPVRIRFTSSSDRVRPRPAGVEAEVT